METKLDRICGNDKLDLIGSVNVFLFFYWMLTDLIHLLMDILMAFIQLE